MLQSSPLTDSLEAESTRARHGQRPPLFKSFWQAGFESACHINKAGMRLDLLAVTQHDQQVASDYALMRDIGVRTVRDGIRWHLIERRRAYDFSSFAPMIEAAQRQGIQVIWNVCHYGWPDDLDLFTPGFAERFASFCYAVACYVKRSSDTVPYYTPINEISFLAWAAGDVGYIYPNARNCGGRLKRLLVRAVIAGIDAIWAADPRARIVHTDPLIHVVAPRNRPDLEQAAASQSDSQFEAWDMLAGYRCPELGGHPRYLDIMGINYYHANQWEHPDVRLRWEDSPRDDRWVPFHLLLARFYQRYRRPFFLAETSHFGVGRGPWLKEIATEVWQVRSQGVPVEGICLYPILDRPDWDDLHHWHNSGLWDLLRDGQGQLQRVLCADYAARLREAQQMFPGRGTAATAPLIEDFQLLRV
jgi:hypothetical protein